MKNILFTLLAFLTMLPAWAEDLHFYRDSNPDNQGVYLKIVKVGSPNNTTFQYRTRNSGSYTDYNSYGTKIAINSDLYIKNKDQNNQNVSSANGYYQFVFVDSNNKEIEAGCVSVSGDLWSIRGSQNGGSDYCFYKLFNNCKAITSFAKSPVWNQNVNQHMFESMFEGCSNLTTVGDFYGANSSNNNEMLQIGEACFKNMFKGCSSLATAPKWRCTTMQNYCYEGMFEGCSSLTKASTFMGKQGSSENQTPTLAVACFRNMYKDCVSLKEAPLLNSTTLQKYCYESMFQGCRELEVAPELPATTLVDGCYKMMFYECSKLNFISVGLTGWNEMKDDPANAGEYISTECTSSWVYGVASKGIFMGPSAIIANPIQNVNHIPEGWVVTPPDYLCFTAQTANSKLRLSGGTDKDYIAYKTGTSDAWTSIHTKDNQIHTITFKVGEKIYIRATTVNSPFNIDQNGPFRFSVEQGSFSISGNIMSLLDMSLAKTDVPDYAFYKLFYNLGNRITDISELKMPATTVGQHSYDQMFYGCTAIKTIPELPATTLGNYCYYGMFMGCSSIVVPSDLPATTLTEGCYESMFQNCSSLVTGPTTLPATQLVTKCYKNMFNGCSNLRYLDVAFEEFSPSNATETWVANVNNEGTFVCPKELKNYCTTLHLGYTFSNSYYNSSQLPKANTNGQRWALPERDGQDYLCFIAMTKGKVVLKKEGNPGAVHLEYQTNKVSSGKWTELTPNKEIVLNQYDFVFLRAKDSTKDGSANPTQTNEKFYFGPNDYWHFLADKHDNSSPSPSLLIRGNIMSIVHNYCKARTVKKDAFRNLFIDNTFILTAPNLPATTVGDNAYESMFEGCEKLINAPELPATNIGTGSYAHMFDGCTSLKSCYDLPATTVKADCYTYMFKDCGKLLNAPALPATSLANCDNCYKGMFYNCSSLVSAPQLNATVLAWNCYEDMFYGCSSLLTSQKELPAPELQMNCYKGMYNGCYSLPSAPALPATSLTDYCYAYMFNGCEKLERAPELPAKSLAQGCYQYMFGGCTTLTVAPDLPATNLKDECYNGIFSGCSHIKYIKADFMEWPTNNATTSWVYNVANKGTFQCSPELGNTGTFDASHKPKDSANPWDIVNDFLCFTALTNEVKVRFVVPDGHAAVNLVYHETARDYGSENPWPAYTPGTYITLTTYGDKVFFKALDSNPNATINTSATEADACHFEVTNYCNVSGDINSLLTEKYTKYAKETTLSQYCYAFLFKNCAFIMDASSLKLSSMKLNNACYYGLFHKCTSLLRAPELPATFVSGSAYKMMFSYCSNLLTAPELPSTRLSQTCYEKMFQHCYVLKNAPKLPATTMKEKCYFQMFYNCKMLEKAPKLPATVMAPNCYQEMFKYCTKLKEIEVQFSDWGTSNTQYTLNWANTWGGSITEGTFRAPDALPGMDQDPNTDTQYHGVSNIPRGWNSELCIIATIPNENHVVPTGYSFSPSNEVINLKTSKALSGEYVLNLPAGTAQYTLVIPAFAKVRKIEFTGTSANAYKGSVTMASGYTKIGTNSSLNNINSAAPSTVKYSVNSPAYDNDIIFNIGENGFCGIITLYGDVNPHLDAPEITYDYLTHELTMTADEEADIYFSLTETTYSEANKSQFTKWISKDEYEMLTAAEQAKTERMFDLSSWAAESSRTPRNYCAVAVSKEDATYTGLTSDVVDRTIYRYSPMKDRYCLVEKDNVQDLKDALNYANDAAGAGSENYVFVFAPTGTYDLGSENIKVSDYVSLIGEDKDGENATIITSSNANGTIVVEGKSPYLQDIKVGNTSTNKNAIDNYSSDAKLYVSLASGCKYYEGSTDMTSSMPDADWDRSKDANQKTISRIACNGATLHVVSEAPAYLVKGLDGEYVVVLTKDFYIKGETPDVLKVRGANSRGGFGDPYSETIEPLKALSTNEYHFYKTDGTTPYALNSYGYATFSFDENDVEGNYQLQVIGAIAYKATYENGAITMDQVNPYDIIPCRSGVIFFGAPNTPLKFYAVPTSGANSVDLTNIGGKSCLKGGYSVSDNKDDKIAGNGLIANYSSDKTNPDYGYVYVLSNDAIKKLKSGGTILKNRAYFHLPKSVTPAASYRMTFNSWNYKDDWTNWELLNSEETGLEEIDVDENDSANRASDGIYSIDGRRATSRSGLIVKEGKILFIK